MKTFCKSLLIGLLLIPSILLADNLLTDNLLADNRTRPDFYAPIGIIGDHTLAQRDFFFAYRLMQNAMEGNRDGRHYIGPEKILSGGANTGDYMLAPLEMSADIHLFHLMFAPTDTMTLMFTMPFITQKMAQAISPMHPEYPSETFSTQSSGLGDAFFSTIFKLEEGEKYNFLFSMGLGIPTGSIGEKDAMLVMPNLGKTQLPFPMQLGSGSYEFVPAFTYKYFLPKRSWGTQVSSAIPLNDNDNGYQHGESLEINLWHAWVINKELSFSTRLQYEKWGNIRGDDNKRELPNTMTLGAVTVPMTPSIDPLKQGGEQLSLVTGASVLFGNKRNHRIAIELSIPLEKDFDGPQIDRDLGFTLGLQTTMGRAN